MDLVVMDASPCRLFIDLIDKLLGGVCSSVCGCARLIVHVTWPSL